GRCCAKLEATARVSGGPRGGADGARPRPETDRLPAGTRQPARTARPARLLRRAVAAGTLFAIDTDAHAPGRPDRRIRGCARAEECRVPAEHVVSTWPADELPARSRAGTTPERARSGADGTHRRGPGTGTVNP
ncbi:hypothetical protein ACFCYL_42560, partial [Streptomyces sp. NPDC056305]